MSSCRRGSSRPAMRQPWLAAWCISAVVWLALPYSTDAAAVEGLGPSPFLFHNSAKIEKIQDDDFEDSSVLPGENEGSHASGQRPPHNADEHDEHADHRVSNSELNCSALDGVEWRPHSDMSPKFLLLGLALWAVAWGVSLSFWAYNFGFDTSSDESASKRSVRGSRGLSTISQGMEDSEQLDFTSEPLERRWLIESEGLLLRRAFSMMCFIAFVLWLIRTIRWWFMPVEKCGEDGTESGSSLFMRIGRQLFRSAILWGVIGLCWWWKDNPLPHRKFYLYFVGFYSLFIPILNSPPFTKTCLTLHEKLVVDDAETGEYYDCSLQGMSSSLLFLCFILATPWILTRYDMMVFIWAWLVFVYFGWTLAYVAVFEEPEWANAGVYGRHGQGGEPSPVAVAVCTLWMVVACLLAIQKKWYLEQAIRKRYLSKLAHLRATKRIYNVLSYMVPETVILEMLKRPNESLSWSYDKVSILFLEIHEFDQFSGKSKPKVVLAFLNKLFNQMDQLCKTFEVNKIETWGHEYVACVGDSEEHKAKAQNCGGHHCLLENLMCAGAAFLKLQRSKAEGNDEAGFEVKFRMGVHTGPINAGVIGQKLPRYRLFGDTINTAARQMQRSQPGKLQFGEETLKELEEVEWLKSVPRGKVLMKGKGEIMTWTLDEESAWRKLELAGKTLPTPDVQEDAAIAQGLGVTSLSPMFWRAVGTFRGKGKKMLSQQLHEELNELPTDMNLDRSEVDDLEGGQQSGDEVKGLDQKLEEIIDKINGDDEDSVKGRKCPWKCCSNNDICNRLFQSILRIRLWPTPLPADLEAKWIKKHHETAVCKKISQRLGRHTVAIAFLVFLEALYLCGVHWKTTDLARFYGDNGIPIFCMTRLGVLMVAIFTWYFVISRETWLKAHRFEGQACLVVSTIVQAVLMFYGYDSLLMRRHVHKHSEAAGEDQDSLARPMERTSGAVVYALVFYMLSRSHQFRWRQNVIMAVFGNLLVWGPKFWFLIHKQPHHCLYGLDGRLLFMFTTSLSVMLAFEEEEESRSRFRANHAREQTKSRSEQALKTLMPPAVVDELHKLKANQPLPSHFYRHATIAQSDLCGFTDLANGKPPNEVVAMVSDLFGRFDRRSDTRGIYKVETVGDAYIAGMADGPLSATHSPADVVLFGLDMIQEVLEWSMNGGYGVQCRVGVHHGECIGGVVGYEMQRYHLFGPLINYIEVLESTGIPSEVQVSIACKEEVERQLDGQNVEHLKARIAGFDSRTSETLETSKGEKHSYDEVGGRTFFVRFNNRQFSLLT